MGRWSKKTKPEQARERFNKVAGNYIITYNDRSVYTGRQSEGSDRIGAHLRKHPRSVKSVEFMEDRSDSECVRAQRELNTLERLEDAGKTVRNQIRPSQPSDCDCD